MKLRRKKGLQNVKRRKNEQEPEVLVRDEKHRLRIEEHVLFMYFYIRIVFCFIRSPTPTHCSLGNEM